MELRDIVKDDKTTPLFGDMTGRDIGNRMIDADYETTGQKLTSLKGSPQNCGRFYAQNNYLETLEFSPVSCKSYSVEDNPRLKTFKGGPKNCGEYFAFNGNQFIDNDLAIKEIIKYQIKADKYELDDKVVRFSEIKEQFDLFYITSKVQSKGFRTLLGLI